VVDDADPIGKHRLRLIVAEVWGGTEAGAWAVPSLPPSGAATPAVGDLVWVTFETSGSFVRPVLRGQLEEPSSWTSASATVRSFLGLLDRPRPRTAGLAEPAARTFGARRPV
jgi:hypothetical protein